MISLRPLIGPPPQCHWSAVERGGGKKKLEEGEGRRNAGAREPGGLGLGHTQVRLCLDRLLFLELALVVRILLLLVGLYLHKLRHLVPLLPLGH